MSLRPFALACVLLMAAGSAQAQSPDALADLSAHAAHASRAARGQHLGSAAVSRVETVRDYLRATHDTATLRDLVQTKEHTSFGTVHVQLKQQVAGLDVYGTYVKASFNSGGELTTIIENLVSTAPGLRPALLGPGAALHAVLARYYPGLAGDPGEVSSEGNTVRYALVAPFYRAPEVTRIAVPLRGNALDTGYLVETWDRKNVLRYTVVSGRGEILKEELRTNYDAYRVFTINPDVTPQQLIHNPADGAASPNGWTTSANTTIGNNVDAYLDRDANDVPDPGSRPVVANNQSFDFVWDGASAPTTPGNQAASVTNLFYLTNLIHDRLYRAGFDEAAGNFQTNNFGKGGLGNDPLNAEGQDGSGVDNANFATPPDGARPRMQMYLWDTTTPGRDGDIDSDIVFHEYTHGLTWRMVGDMSGAAAGAVGEGMSDAIATYFNNNDRVAEYSSNNPIGIRTAPYTNYTRTYAYVVGLFGPHLDGEIYAAALWRLRQLWLGQGWSQETLLKYLVDGLNYTPLKPAYEDMRDGILSSIVNMSTELDPHDAGCTVWNAFAQYGIGVGADGYDLDVLGLTFFKATESFVVPADCPAGPPPNQTPIVAITQPITGTTVTQGTSVTFAGTATDNEDGNLTANLTWSSSLDGNIGSGATFSTSTLSVGTHVISASVTDSGGLTGSAGIVVIVNSSSNTPPGVSITAPANGSSFVQGASVNFTGTASDAEEPGISGANLVWTSDRQPGGVIGTGASFSRSDLVVGTHIITASATDGGGLTGSASITVTITAPNTAPTVSISAPANGSSVIQGTAVTFTGSATDTQDGNLSGGLAWTSNLQGPIGTGASFSKSNLFAGTHIITASVTDSGGLTGSASITLTVNNTAPVVSISSPANGSSVIQGTSVTFTGSANDTQDGNISAGLTWTSNLQGVIGTGASFSRSNLVKGTHTITASITDSGGQPGSASITLTVNNTAPVVSITSPANGSSVTQGTSVTFTGSANDTQDGNISAGLAWTSSLQGAIGTGASFSTSGLVVGTHTITASVTDSGGAPGSASITITVTAPVNITLSASGSKQKGTNVVSLTWSGATTSVDVKRNGVTIATVANTGAYTDSVGKGKGTFNYQVCNAGTSTCSNIATVSF